MFTLFKVSCIDIQPVFFFFFLELSHFNKSLNLLELNAASEIFWRTFYNCWLLNSLVLTLPSLHSSYDPEGLVQVTFCASQNWVYIWPGVSLYTYTASPIVIQNLAHWKLIGCSLFAPPPVLSPLQPPSHCTFISERKTPVRILKMLLF